MWQGVEAKKVKINHPLSEDSLVPAYFLGGLAVKEQTGQDSWSKLWQSRMFIGDASQIATALPPLLQLWVTLCFHTALPPPGHPSGGAVTSCHRPLA